MRHVVDRFICVAFNFSDGLSNSGCLSVVDMLLRSHQIEVLTAKLNIFY